MWMLGKTAALAASARIATSHQGRARQLSERIDLTREIHERVMQRLFGVSLVVGSERELSAEERARCADEIQAALARPAERAVAPAGAGGRSERGDAAGGARPPRPPLQGAAAPRELGARASPSPTISSRWRSRWWRRRCATPTSTPEPSRVEVTRERRRRNAHARGPKRRGRARAAPAARAARAWDCGSRPSRPSSAAASSSSGRRREASGARAWWCRCTGSAGERRPPAARARGRRPRRRALGLPAAPDRAAVGRALPDRARAGGGARRSRAATSRTSRSSTSSWVSTQAPSCARRCGASARAPGSC